MLILPRSPTPINVDTWLVDTYRYYRTWRISWEWSQLDRRSREGSRGQLRSKIGQFSWRPLIQSITWPTGFIILTPFQHPSLLSTTLFHMWPESSPSDLDRGHQRSFKVKILLIFVVSLNFFNYSAYFLFLIPLNWHRNTFIMILSSWWLNFMTRQWQGRGQLEVKPWENL